MQGKGFEPLSLGVKRGYPSAKTLIYRNNVQNKKKDIFTSTKYLLEVAKLSFDDI